MGYCIGAAVFKERSRARACMMKNGYDGISCHLRVFNDTMFDERVYISAQDYLLIFLTSESVI